MKINRRLWLAGSFAFAAASGASARIAAPTITLLAKGRRDPTALLDAIGAYATAELAAFGLPGMVIAVSTPDGLRATLAIGSSDRDRGVSMRPDRVVQIGSISKSLVAFALFRLAAEGRFDLDASANALLPDVPWPDVAITVPMLLNHSSALPDAFDAFPRSPDRRLWTNFKPGERFYYSNLGFNLLGAMLAKASGMPFPQALRRYALDPLGMAGAHPVIMTRDRAEYATGYQQFDDRPWTPDKALAPGIWFELDEPSGSVAATAAAMTAYIDAWTMLGRGKSGRLLPDALARRLVAPTITAPKFGEGARYANGIAVTAVDDRACLYHSGGMPCFRSAVTIDPAFGGVFACTNSGVGDYRPRGVTDHGARLLRAWSQGNPLPAPPAIEAVSPIAEPNRLIGRYLAQNGDVIVIRMAAGGLVAEADGVAGRILSADDRFFADHPRLYFHEFYPVEQEGPVKRLWWGGTLYGRDDAIPTPPPGAAIRDLTGYYSQSGPWGFTATLVARGNALIVEGLGSLARFPDGGWRVEGGALPGERFWFDAFIDGKPQRLLMGTFELGRFEPDPA